MIRAGTRRAVLVFMILGLIASACASTPLTIAEESFCLEDLNGDTGALYAIAEDRSIDDPVTMLARDVGYQRYLDDYTFEERSELEGIDSEYDAAYEAWWFVDMDEPHRRWLESDDGSDACRAFYLASSQSVAERLDLHDDELVWCSNHLEDVTSAALVLGIDDPDVKVPTVDDWSLHRPMGFERACTAAFSAADGSATEAGTDDVSVATTLASEFSEQPRSVLDDDSISVNEYNEYIAEAAFLAAHPADPGNDRGAPISVWGTGPDVWARNVNMELTWMDLRGTGNPVVLDGFERPMYDRVGNLATEIERLVEYEDLGCHALDVALKSWVFGYTSYGNEVGGAVENEAVALFVAGLDNMYPKASVLIDECYTNDPRILSMDLRD